MKVVVSDNLIPEVLELIKSTNSEVVYKPDSLESALQDAEVLVIRSATKVTPELLSHAKKLKMVIRGGVGLDNVDIPECKRLGITVANTPGASTNAVAEFALGLILSAVRNIPFAYSSLKSSKWEKKRFVGNEVKGRVLGLIGCGRIGASLGQKANALGMKVIGYNPVPRRDYNFIEYVDSLDDLFSRADIISLHVPSTPETKNMINVETISKMKDGVVLINTARGTIIEENDLYAACKSNKISVAALDVYPSEPYTGKLLELQNIIVTPHIAASTSEAQIGIGKEIAEKIRSLQV